jgi:hypothetical protein
VTDGAFVETKEVLGGYYLIEVADEAAAIEVAKQLPAPFGEIEVRKGPRPRLRRPAGPGGACGSRGRSANRSV